LFAAALKRLESNAGIRTMCGVLRPGQMLTCLLMGLTACSTPTRQAPTPLGPYRNTDAERRTAPATMERVPAEPRLAPPPAGPDASASRVNSYAETWIPLSRWARENGFGLLQEDSSGPAPSFVLATARGALKVSINSPVADWDGVELHLGYDPQLINELPYVHVVDLKKNIEPLLRGLGAPTRTNGIIVIDPGHGGSNTGTTSIEDGTPEKEFTLDWAQRIGALLATNGWQVFLTRTDDEDLPLSNRVTFAEEHHADLFISLHFNSATPGGDQAGVETYCLTPPGLPSTLTRGYDDDSSLIFPNNAFDAQNLQYAVLLQRALLKVVGMDRGVRRARFLGVLRGQNRPAVLIEGGYLSNPREARLIADPAYRQKLAEAVAGALTGEAGASSADADSEPAEGN
jgi:N-acetylmuramoyl-L-alanine amidase